MENSIRLTRLDIETTSSCDCEPFGIEQGKRSAHFHASFPGYAPTPLVSLKSLAADTCVASIHVKDESKRFGLNAFKALGASYAVGRSIADRLGIPEEEMTYDLLIQEGKKLDQTLITATDGNHGRGVAWTANRMGQKCVVYMPYGTAPERLENIRKLGANASIIDGTYDDAVHRAAREAAENGWMLVQDTAWEGYTEIPTRIMQGYTTMGHEISMQMSEVPTHIFLQAGVGSMAGAIAAYFTELAERYGIQPVITVVEPHAADCFYRTAEAGEIRSVTGRMDTIMAGLACGTPCPIVWELLKKHAAFYASMPDSAAATGMRVLGNPMGGDARIVSGESGASGFGFAYAALRDHTLRRQLGINAESRLLCISTEGDTDRENYRRIVWDGAYPR